MGQKGEQEPTANKVGALSLISSLLVTHLCKEKCIKGETPEAKGREGAGAGSISKRVGETVIEASSKTPNARLKVAALVLQHQAKAHKCDGIEVVGQGDTHLSGSGVKTGS